MSPDQASSESSSRRGLRILADNPLYEYLLELQEKKVLLLETLAPRRHIVWQGLILLILLILWLVDILVPVPAVKGFPIALIITVGPLVILGGLYLAGWNVQMLAVKCYPSPLDLPRALELLLTTPLTETEIVHATVGAYLRYPFIGLSWKRFGLVVLNLVTVALIMIESNLRGTLPVEILSMSLKIYLPAFCVFLFFPVLTAFDLLLVPSGWLRRQPTELTDTAESLLGRTGRLPGLAMLIIMIPVLIRINMTGPLMLVTTRWILTLACPGIILLLTGISLILIAILPNHIASIRRG